MSFWATETDRVREPPAAAVRIPYGYFVEVAPNDYEPTADPMRATHVHVMDAPSNEIVIAPIGTEAGGVQTLRIGPNSYAIFIGL